MITTQLNLTILEFSAFRLLYPPPWPINAKFGTREHTHALRLHAKFYPDRLFALLLMGEKLKFYGIFKFNILRWRHLAARDKVEGECTSTNRSRSNGIKIVSEFKRLNGKVTFTNITV